jgi:hypothetical protein
LPDSWPEVEVEFLPNFNGNVINDPSIIQFIEDGAYLPISADVFVRISVFCDLDKFGLLII